MRATPLLAPQPECSLETRGEKRGGVTAPKRRAGHDDDIYAIFWVASMRMSVPIERGDAQREPKTARVQCVRAEKSCSVPFCTHRDGQGEGAGNNTRREDASQASDYRGAAGAHRCANVEGKRPCAPPANQDAYDDGAQAGTLRRTRVCTLEHPCYCGHKGNRADRGVEVSPTANRIGDTACQGDKQFKCHGCHDAPSTMPRANKKAPTTLELEESGWRRRESNPRPLPCDGSALPTELRPQDKCL